MAAHNAVTTIKLPMLNNDEGEAVLHLETYKGFRPGIISVARFQRVRDGMSSFMVFSDFHKTMKTTPNRATQKAIDSQHDAVFTHEVKENLAREAVAFYNKTITAD
jgi:hypothetical protein